MLGALSSISNLLNIAILQSPAIYCCTIVVKIDGSRVPDEQI